jgi:hypothetical protein
VDLPGIVSEFIEEIMGAHGAYSLVDIGELDEVSDAAAHIRLRLKVYDAMIAEGWEAPAEVAERHERDRQLLAERDEEVVTVAWSRAEEYATLRARASRARDDARRGQVDAKERRESAAENRDEVGQMRRALESRAVIEQAKGIAMERHGLPAEVAWSWLVRTSQNRNVKLRAVAEELVASVVRFSQSRSDGDLSKSSPKPSAPSDSAPSDSAPSESVPSESVPSESVAAASAPSGARTPSA